MLKLVARKFPKGSCILMQGTENKDHFFLIKSGKVTCYRNEDTAGEGLISQGAGDFIGLVSCMAGSVQIETCVATTDVEAILIKKDQYMELLHDNPEVSLRILRMFSKRMRMMNERLTQLSYAEVVKDTPEHIFEVAKFYDETRHYSIALFAYYQYLLKFNKKESADYAWKRYNELLLTSHAVYMRKSDDFNRYYPKDAMVFSESQWGNEVFIVIDGQVKVTKIVDDQEVILAKLGVGDIFGEMALLEDKPRSASVITTEQSLIMCANRDSYKDLVNMQLKLVPKVTEAFSKRICLIYKKFDNVNMLDPQFKLMDMLAIYIEEQLGSVQEGLPYQTDLNLKELCSMCGIPEPMQESAIDDFIRNPKIRIIDDKIYVPDCEDIVKQSYFYHKKNEQMQRHLRQN